MFAQLGYEPASIICAMPDLQLKRGCFALHFERQLRHFRINAGSRKRDISKGISVQRWITTVKGVILLLEFTGIILLMAMALLQVPLQRQKQLRITVSRLSVVTRNRGALSSVLPSIMGQGDAKLCPAAVYL